ncbi:hypothetical protein Ae406Ps2_6051 [Pseudonocardia sp. Ae406_Ps2]|nr:hypothetical protein Ae406Ps2_6051 [Pseudonocardia sp. Ae406_Ps2]OLM28085.1 hypothetical protein Ae717Ps2_6824c [Pseudonocardia sp. Ae717_Ps2]
MHDPAQPRVTVHRELLRPLPRRQGPFLRCRGPVLVASAVTTDLTRDHRPITTHHRGDLLVGQALRETPRDLLPIRQHQHLTHGTSCPAEQPRSSATTG